MAKKKDEATQAQSQPSQDIRTEESNSSYTPVGEGSDHHMNTVGGTGMSDSDKFALKSYGDVWNAADAEYKATGSQDALTRRDQAHAEAEAIRAKYGYSGGQDGSQFIETPKSQDARPPASYTAQVPDFTTQLDAWLAAATKQQASIDYATDKAVADLERAEEDAQQRFQTQQDQVSEDEAKALDNQALYAEARGDRGGVGQAQYGQIQAAAMQNRRAINTARTQLATDTARQIADLRAQGEYEKADALLQLTQTYLGQLVELQQWGAEYALSVEQFNQQLIQWEKEFNLQSEQWKTQFDYTVSQNDRAYLAEAGMAALAAGIRPSAAQQQAMGYTDAQVTAALNAYKLAQATGVTVDAGGKIIDPQLDPYGYLYAKGVTDRNVVLSNLASIFKDSGDYVDFEAMADEYIRLVEEWKKAEEYANMEIDEEDTYKKFGRMVNPEWLSEQVASGALVEYEYNGKIRFARSPYASVFSSSFGGGANFNTFAGGKGGM